jgi:hypothetical protein
MRRNGSPSVSRFHVQAVSMVAAILFLARSGCAQSPSNPWLILGNGKKATITAHTTRLDLVHMFGASNVVDRDVDVGEGETQPGTVLFPRDPKRLIEILWMDLDKKTQPTSAQIQSGRSRWKSVYNISLGTSLKDLERFNGRPFKLAGFGWDYSGTVTSWENGALAAELNGEHRRVILRLDSTPESVEKDIALAGDGDFSSHHPVMQKLNPTVYQIIWVFGPPAAN